MRADAATQAALSFTPQWLPLTGGDYRGGGVGANRTAQEQHPFHMHGHHFWVLGYGLGNYNESTNSSSLNLHNPAFRDSFTIFKNGWTVIRFKVSDDVPSSACPSRVATDNACQYAWWLLVEYSGGAVYTQDPACH